MPSPLKMPKGMHRSKRLSVMARPEQADLIMKAVPRGGSFSSWALKHLLDAADPVNSPHSVNLYFQ